MEHVLSVVVLGVIGLASWLLPKYLERRVAEAARGAVDVSVGKTLADHRHMLDVQMEEYRQGLTGQIEQLRHALATERDRSAKDYGLFAERRNEVYAETYSLFEKARGGYSNHFASLIITQNFGRSPESDLRNLARKLERISEGERERLVAALDAHRMDDARQIANELFERNSLRDANNAFREFRIAWVVHALYFSPDVSGVLSEAAQALAHLNVFADEIIQEGHRAPLSPTDRKSRLQHVDKLDELSTQLRRTMRAEMQPNSESTQLRPAPPA